MQLFRSNQEPIRVGLSWNEAWAQADDGLIACWDRGREMSQENKVLAERARQGELVVLPFKGGVEKRIKSEKVGTFFYLAMWQGLRGDDLEIDTERDLRITCRATGVTVVYTGDYSRYSVA